MTTARAASAVPATPAASLVLVGESVEASARRLLRRFEESIQSVLDAPLDALRVAEWTSFRALHVPK